MGKAATFKQAGIGSRKPKTLARKVLKSYWLTARHGEFEKDWCLISSLFKFPAIAVSQSYQGSLILAAVM
ncbi:hypothetical protein C1I38_10585 [Dehalobacter sp. 12DCB1]|nr:hypothetical protein C1I36_08825 [Dehalobacter sp. 14DCB1]TCX51221.1 hypothetical protein C1I38_10585 [Dehalobacter sp. 12DCB1]